MEGGNRCPQRRHELPMHARNGIPILCGLVEARPAPCSGAPMWALLDHFSRGVGDTERCGRYQQPGMTESGLRGGGALAVHPANAPPAGHEATKALDEEYTCRNALAETIWHDRTPGDQQTIPTRVPFSVPCACWQKTTHPDWIKR